MAISNSRARGSNLLLSVTVNWKDAASRFPQQCCWCCKSSGMWFCVAGSTVTDIWKEHAASSWLPSKHQKVNTPKHSTTFQNIWILTLEGLGNFSDNNRTVYVRHQQFGRTHTRCAVRTGLHFWTYTHKMCSSNRITLLDVHTQDVQFEQDYTFDNTFKHLQRLAIQQQPQARTLQPNTAAACCQHHGTQLIECHSQEETEVHSCNHQRTENRAEPRTVSALHYSHIALTAVTTLRIHKAHCTFHNIHNHISAMSASPETAPSSIRCHLWPPKFFIQQLKLHPRMICLSGEIVHPSTARSVRLKSRQCGTSASACSGTAISP
jgi:hypothetical protein